MGQMCSITNTAHAPPTSPCRLRALSRPRRRCRHVYLFSYLLIISSDALRSSVLTDFDFEGACNQGGKFLFFILVASLVDTRSVACVSVTMKRCVSVTMKRCVSVFQCVLTTLLKSTFEKKPHQATRFLS